VRREHAGIGQPSQTVSGEATMIHRTARFVSVAALMGACLAPATQAQSAPALVDQLRAKAVASFQQARFPEAYGRFIALADAGHVPAAERAVHVAVRHSAVRA